MIIVRASSGDRIMLCNYSSKKPEMLIDTSGPWSNFGIGGHSIMHKIVKDNMSTMPDISKAIDEYKIEDEKALRIACHIGLKEWNNTIKDSIDRDHLVTETRHERQIDGKHVLSGHPDIACLLHDPTVLFIGDWKFGEISDHWNQLKAYAFILKEKFPNVETVLLGQYFLRCNDKDVREFSMDHIENEWAPKFIEALHSDTLKPSWNSCKYCPIIECEARDRLSLATISSLAVVDHRQSTSIKLASVFEDVKLLEKQIAKYKAHLKDEIEMTGEPIPMGDGKVIDLVDSHRSTLYLYQAIGILKDYFGKDTLDDLVESMSHCITLKKSDVMDLISQHATRGMKGSERNRIEAAMDRAGAIKTKNFKKLELRRGGKS